jgi:hypothetical protein
VGNVSMLRLCVWSVSLVGNGSMLSQQEVAAYSCQVE